MARQAIRKSVRMEVLKRDCFTCQYCGQKAPNVVIEIDHIKPVAAGGDNHILNLVAACRACNAGKSDKLLSDTSAAVKAQAQAEKIQERRQSLQEMAEWHLSLVDFDSHPHGELEQLWLSAIQASPATSLVPAAKEELCRLSKTYGNEATCIAIVKVANSLIKKGLHKDTEERNGAFWLIGKVCSVTRAEGKDPGIGRLFYIRGILRRRCQYLNDGACIELLRDARNCGIDVERMVDFAKQVFSWSQFRDAVLDHINKYHAERTEATDGTHAIT